MNTYFAPIPSPRARYATGVVYSHAGDEWTDGQPVSYGPEWHRTRELTDEVVTELTALGYSVTVVTR